MKTIKCAFLFGIIILMLIALPSSSQATKVGSNPLIQLEDIQIVNGIDGEAKDDIFSPGGWGIENLSGMDIQVSDKIPSGWGLFWKGVKETVSTTLTFDPVKKAEKRLKYAEERMRLAEQMANSSNPKIQAKAQKMVEKANKFMEKIEAKKDKWMNKTGERAQRLITNMATHQINREVIFDKLQNKLPEDKYNKLKSLRDQSIERGQR